MKIFVTGGSGFVGRAIVEELIECPGETWEIYTSGSKKSSKNNNLPRYTKINITNKEDFNEVENIGKLNVIVHSAGLAHQFRDVATDDFYKVNVVGTKNVLEFAAEKSVEHFVLISSVSVYGSSDENDEEKKSGIKINEEHECLPQSEYGMSKLEAEKIAIKFCLENRMALTILRLATVIGENDLGNVSRLIEAVDKRKFLMAGRGENHKTLIYKKDAARACRQIIEKKDIASKSVEIFNVVAEPVSMKFIVEQIFQSLDRKPPKIFLPDWFLKVPLRFFAFNRTKKLKGISETLKKWLSEEVFFGESIQQKYSFKPETTVAEALQREVESYKKQKC